MKILILLFSLAILSCNNESAQKQAHLDTVRMWADSMVKYTDQKTVSDSSEAIRKARLFIAETMWKHYKRKAEGKED